MSLVFPESYDELAVLAHHGATEKELARRLAERELMAPDARFRSDVSARAHVGPTIGDHRARWARLDGVEHHGIPARPGEAVDIELSGDGSGGRLPDMPESAYPPGAVPLDGPEPPTAADVPTGPVADVLAWVGTDPERARAAIDAENARTHPRASLLAKLRKDADG